MPNIVKTIQQALAAAGDPQRAEHSAGYFKTGKGEYGEGDKFRGVRVPEVRKLVRKYYRELTLTELTELLHSEFHEDRLFAVIALAEKFKRASTEDQKRIYTLYLKHTHTINNWDLVDSSAHLIVGPWLVDRDQSILNELAVSDNLWERRIAMLATFHYIKNGSFDKALEIAEILVHDDEDLIHKAVGWMLREIGNRDRSAEEPFLRKYYRSMPRTMLRYAIEKFPEERRQAYLKGTI